MHYKIIHRTEYAYSNPVTVAHNLARLSPINLPNQACLGNVVRVEPAPDVQTQFTDFFGNIVTFFAIHRPTHAMTVEAVSEVEVWNTHLPEPEATPPWQAVRDELAHPAGAEALAAFQFKLESEFTPLTAAVRDYAASSFEWNVPVLQAAMRLIGRIHTDFKYEPQSTTISTSLDELLAQKRGVCQDFTHLALACLRQAGLAARYISGYLRTIPKPGQPRLTGVDQSHAWLALYVPGSGWIDLDPTNNMLCGTDHIRVAVGRDYNDICPVRGVVIGGGRQVMRVSVDVEEFGEASLF